VRSYCRKPVSAKRGALAAKWKGDGV